MNNLKRYILEKLHINKDTKIRKSFEKGDFIMVVTLSEGVHNYIFISTKAVFLFEGFFDNKLILKNNQTNRKYISPNVYLNEFGYYENNEKDEIYLSLEESKNFVEDIIKGGWYLVIPNYFELNEDYRDKFNNDKFRLAYGMEYYEKLLKNLKSKITRNAKSK